MKKVIIPLILIIFSIFCFTACQQSRDVNQDVSEEKSGEFVVESATSSVPEVLSLKSMTVPVVTSSKTEPNDTVVVKATLDRGNYSDIQWQLVWQTAGTGSPSDFVNMTVDSGNSFVTLQVKKPFGDVILLRANLKSAQDIKAECTLNYISRLLDVSDFTDEYWDISLRKIWDSESIEVPFKENMLKWSLGTKKPNFEVTYSLKPTDLFWQAADYAAGGPGSGVFDNTYSGYNSSSEFFIYSEFDSDDLSNILEVTDIHSEYSDFMEMVSNNSAFFAACWMGFAPAFELTATVRAYYSGIYEDRITIANTFDVYLSFVDRENLFDMGDALLQGEYGYEADDLIICLCQDNDSHCFYGGECVFCKNSYECSHGAWLIDDQEQSLGYCLQCGLECPHENMEDGSLDCVECGMQCPGHVFSTKDDPLPTGKCDLCHYLCTHINGDDGSGRCVDCGVALGYFRSSGLKLMTAYSMSDSGVETIKVTANITPATTTVARLGWRMSMAGYAPQNYLQMDIADDYKSADFTVLQPFPTAITLTVYSIDDEQVKDTCRFEYIQRLQGLGSGVIFTDGHGNYLPNGFSKDSGVVDHLYKFNYDYGIIFDGPGFGTPSGELNTNAHVTINFRSLDFDLGVGSLQDTYSASLTATFNSEFLQAVDSAEGITSSDLQGDMSSLFNSKDPNEIKIDTPSGAGYKADFTLYLEMVAFKGLFTESYVSSENYVGLYNALTACGGKFLDLKIKVNNTKSSAESTYTIKVDPQSFYTTQGSVDHVELDREVVYF